jgi:hypothetical protein
MFISGSATSDGACSNNNGPNIRTAYLQKTAPNTGAGPEVNDFVYENAEGTNPVDSYDGSSWYGFLAAPGGVPKSFNITGVTGQVVTVNTCPEPTTTSTSTSTSTTTSA